MILIFDVAASESGALTILQEWYREALADSERQYVFVVSTPELVSQRNVVVLRFPWVKKSWFHRLWFERFFARKIAARYEPDTVISLQNILVSGIDAPQTVYLHNPLPLGLTDARFSLLEAPRLWVYQHMIGRGIRRSVERCDRVVTQTDWMRRRCAASWGVDPSKIEVRRPESFTCCTAEGFAAFVPSQPLTFFYPATPLLYKNHSLILDACGELAKLGVGGYRIVFTLDESDVRARHVLSRVREEDLPIEFAGRLSADRMAHMYKRSVLLFPSYLETWGVPISEASHFGAPLLLADCEYAHETVGEYADVEYFDPHDAHDLAQTMIKAVERFACEK